MIGWTHKFSDDYATAVINGAVDDDLDRMLTTIQLRKDTLKFPGCPECGEPLTHTHEHATKVVVMTSEEYSRLNRTAIRGD